MTACVEYSLEHLGQLLAQPAAAAGQRLRQAGALCVLEPEPPADPAAADPAAPGRWQTLVILPQRVLLLADVFRAATSTAFTLLLNAAGLGGGRRRYTAAEAGLSVHPLGDYLVAATPAGLAWTQTVPHGRFLLVLTRDPAAQARVLNGWSVEVRGGDRVLHIMHANRSGRLRPLGPVQTDARYALAEWPAAAGQAERTGFDAELSFLQATRLVWDASRQLTLAAPGDGVYGGSPSAA